MTHRTGKKHFFPSDDDLPKTRIVAYGTSHYIHQCEDIQEGKYGQLLPCLMMHLNQEGQERYTVQGPWSAAQI